MAGQIFDLALTGRVIEDGVLPAAYRAKLGDWARNTVAYFASPQSNNKLAGLTHSWFGSGTWRELVGGTWQIKPDLKRGYGSYVVVNEITLGFNALAVAFREGWLSYADTWPQILQGLTTLRRLQTSANPDKYVAGTFHRSYLTTRLDAQNNDVDLAPDEIVQDGQNRQSSDDNALSYLNLLVLRGLAADPDVPVPETERGAAVALIDQILADIDLRRFYQNGQIVFGFRNGTPSADG